MGLEPKHLTLESVYPGWEGPLRGAQREVGWGRYAKLILGNACWHIGQFLLCPVIPGKRAIDVTSGLGSSHPVLRVTDMIWPESIFYVTECPF